MTKWRAPSSELVVWVIWLLIKTGTCRCLGREMPVLCSLVLIPFLLYSLSLLKYHQAQGTPLPSNAASPVSHLLSLACSCHVLADGLLRLPWTTSATNTEVSAPATHCWDRARNRGGDPLPADTSIQTWVTEGLAMKNAFHERGLWNGSGLQTDVCK